MKQASIGIIGLGAMGQNLARNFANHKIPTIVYNRTTEKMEVYLKKYGSEHLFGAKNLPDFAAAFKGPRVIMLMIEAGPAVDEIIAHLTPFLEKGDVIIDGGNSYYPDTVRRESLLKSIGIHFVGCGVSGGEEGALHGPSLMPGGSKKSWQLIKPTFEKIAAKDFQKKPCVTYIGPDGAGHFVKMVHNGIEYGVMQVMAEGYDLLRKLYKLPSPRIAKIFQKYNRGKLQSFLFEIAVPVMTKKDDISKDYLIDRILDRAGQKGTGKWTSVEALNTGITLSTLTEAVYARTNSAALNLRHRLAKLYKPTKFSKKPPLARFEKLLEDAMYSAILTCYAQGYHLISEISGEMEWAINLSEVSRIWEGGCIIRSKILNFLHKAFAKSKKEMHLFEIPEVKRELTKSLPTLRQIASLSALSGIPSPALSSSLNYFDGITSSKTPANFIQGLRDHFGAHTYERTDKKGIFHTNWHS